MNDLIHAPVSVWHLAASVPPIAAVLWFAWRVVSRVHQSLEKAQQQHHENAERQNKLMDSWWQRHEDAEERQRETQEKLALTQQTMAANIALNSLALKELAANIKLQTPSLDTLTHEIHSMNNSHTDIPGIGVPGGHFEPAMPYSLRQLQQAGETRPWTHERYGIPALHRLGITGKGAVVVVVDTGVDGVHPDLAANLDLPASRSFVPGESLNDLNGHGTHCSGIVAADNQGIGTLGIAPDAVVVNMKGLSNRGSGAGAWLGGAIRAAADTPGHKIFSLSFGAAGEDRQISDAIRYAVSKGHWVCAAAGNEGPGSINWPGAMPEVICVGALDNQDRVAAFSSANDNVDVGFGGVEILSTIPGNRYARYSGTSMATPGVASVLALAKGELERLGKPIPNQQAMAEVLYATCKDVGVPGKDPGAGFGLVQPAEFIRRLAGAAPLPVPPKPAEPVRIAVPEGAKFVLVQFQ